MTSKSFFDKYRKLFLEENSKVNLISKNDEKYLWEKHIYDSLSIEKFLEKYYPLTTKDLKLLDIGTGGGFPSVPIAMSCPEIKVTALDSIAKKIRAVETLARELNLINLTPVCSRVENYKGEFDIVTSRAVASLKKISEYALPKLKHGGYFIAYKSKKAQEEIKDAEATLKKFNAKIMDIIEYDLPLGEKITRNLIVIKKY